MPAILYQERIPLSVEVKVASPYGLYSEGHSDRALKRFCIRTCGTSSMTEFDISVGGGFSEIANAQGCGWMVHESNTPPHSLLDGWV